MCVLFVYFILCCNFLDYEKLVSRDYSFPQNSSCLLGVNDPKIHKHLIGKFDPLLFQRKMSVIVILLESRFMKSSHLKPLCKLVFEIFEKVAMYTDYCAAQKK